MGNDVLIIQASDLGAHSVQATYLIPILTQSPTITTASLPNASQGAAYSTQLAAINGVGPLSWFFTSSTGTNGWAVSPTGLLTGTPLNIETDNITFGVQDALGNSSSLTLPLIVTAASGTLSLLFPQSVPGGVGIQMQFTMQAYGPGLTLPINWLTASVGSIDSAGNWTFTPVGAGSQLVTITFSDSGGHTGSGSFTCVIT